MAGTSTSDDAHDGVGRLGLLGHGVYYLLLALLCGRLLLGSSGDPGARGAIATVARQPFGQVLLAALTCAFGAYAVIRWIRVAREKDLSSRATSVLRASVWTALTLLGGEVLLSGLTGSGGGGGGDTGTSITRSVLAVPGGTWIVAAVGVCLIGVALYQAKKAANGNLSSELTELGLEGRRIARWLGRAGYAGRAVAYGTVAAFVIHAALTHDPEAGRGLDGALSEVQQSSYGPWLLLAVTGGFAAFGAFRLLEARYARDAT